MKKKTPLDQDHPGVAEVRRWRAKVFKDAGGTIAGLVRLMGRTPPASATQKPAKRPKATSRRRAATPRPPKRQA